MFLLMNEAVLRKGVLWNQALASDTISPRDIEAFFHPLRIHHH